MGQAHIEFILIRLPRVEGMVPDRPFSERSLYEAQQQSDAHMRRPWQQHEGRAAHRSFMLTRLPKVEGMVPDRPLLPSHLREAQQQSDARMRRPWQQHERGEQLTALPG